MRDRTPISPEAGPDQAPHRQILRLRPLGNLCRTGRDLPGRGYGLQTQGARRQLWALPSAGRLVRRLKQELLGRMAVRVRRSEPAEADARVAERAVVPLHRTGEARPLQGLRSATRGAGTGLDPA